MSKIFNNRLVDWDNQKEDVVDTQSSVSEYQSGKVQKNIATERAIFQEILDTNKDGLGQHRVIKSSQEIKDNLTGNLEIIEEAQRNFNQRSNSSNNHFLAEEDFLEKVISNKSDTVADDTFTSYIADKINISFNDYKEVSTGDNTITATKSINIKSDKNEIRGANTTFSSMNSSMKTSQNMNMSTPDYKVKSGQTAIKFQEMNIDADTVDENFNKQEFQARDSGVLENYEKEPYAYYIGEVVYINKSKTLYFINKSDCKDVFNLSRKNFMFSQEIYSSGFSHLQNAKASGENTSVKRILNKQQKLIDDKEVFAISFVRPSFSMLDETELAKLNVLKTSL